MKVSLLSMLLTVFIPILSVSAIEPCTLQIADWSVSIGTVMGQELSFAVGSGGGTNPNVKVHVYDKCRMEGADGVLEGDFYRSSIVPGMTSVTTGVTGLGNTANSIAFSFTEGIEQNTNIYTDNGDNTATVKFCALVGLYDGTVLINFAEVKLTYDIDLVTSFTQLTGYAVSQANLFTNTTTTAIAFDGTLLSYFCDPTTKLETTSSHGITVQGEMLYVCFKVADGQFQIRDILDLTIVDGSSSTSQSIIADGSIQSAFTPFAEKSCTDVDALDTNICVVKLLLHANFYFYSALTLTGNGQVLLELGNAPGRQLRTSSFRLLQEEQGKDTTKAPFMIPPAQYETVPVSKESSAGKLFLPAAFGIGTVVSMLIL